jgi:isocitrate dehydrogenase (NAD+)
MTPSEQIRVAVLDGDETGQELLEQSLRVLAKDVIGLDIKLDHFDLSLANRRATENRVVFAAAKAMSAAGLGIKAATITPEGADDVGSPNRILREELGAKVIVRTGRRIPGVETAARVRAPISVVRMAVGDAYGAQERREGTPGSDDELAMRTERITRGDCRAVAEYAFRTARRHRAIVYGGPKWTVSPVYEGMFKEEMDAAAARHGDVKYEPVLIDATYAGLMNAPDSPLVIPALNRDGDCLGDLVLPMFGSIAGAESAVLSLNDDHSTRIAMLEAPHGTAPGLYGKDVANPMAMILACAALLHFACEAGSPVAGEASRAIYAAAARAVADGFRTSDLGGATSTSQFTEAVIGRVRDELGG